MEVPRCCCKVSTNVKSLCGSGQWVSPEAGLVTNFRHRLEERRKVKGAAYYARKKTARRNLAEAQKSAKVDGKVKEQLASFGY